MDQSDSMMISIEYKLGLKILISGQYIQFHLVELYKMETIN
jgi:hypothetical protein